MGAFRFIYNNFSLGATITCLSSKTDADYPAVNLQDDAKMTFWQSSAGLTNVSIVFDLGSALSIRGCGIFGHNFGSQSIAAVLLQYGTADNGTVFENTAFTYVPGTSDVDHFELITEKQKRYWRLAVTKGSAFTVHIGEVQLGKYLDCDFGPDYGMSYPDQFNTGEARSAGQRVYTTLRDDSPMRAWTLSFTKLSKANLSILHDIWITQSGSLHPFTMIEFDTSGSSGLARFVGFPARFAPSYPWYGIRNVAFSLEEVR